MTNAPLDISNSIITVITVVETFEQKIKLEQDRVSRSKSKILVRSGRSASRKLSLKELLEKDANVPLHRACPPLRPASIDDDVISVSSNRPRSPVRSRLHAVEATLDQIETRRQSYKTKYKSRSKHRPVRTHALFSVSELTNRWQNRAGSVRGDKQKPDWN